ncbi:hypothetical protein [Paenibacillus sp. NEAU-GSW1]|uniref:hypothetical protein n=1 Tax=Paenibacillus sp. NEAU-GSW1 TaxID=2682486 RepID=UPI0012E15C65|nr:hypothetical protein [Paenibacillus sp. NEAU-GSW1]MUT67788.1 hypothetical protein [Paenibacillus sp. NEAU-GSW1]
MAAMEKETPSGGSWSARFVILLIALIGYWILYRNVIYKWLTAKHATLEWYFIAAAALPFLIYVIAIFFIYKKRTFIKLRKRDLILLLFWLVVLPIPSFGAMYENNKDVTYTYNRWVSEYEYREEMLKGLLRKQPLVGVNRERVVSLLGAPNEPYDYEQGDRFVYRMGVEKETESYVYFKQLIILFGHDDRVSRYETTTAREAATAAPS